MKIIATLSILLTINSMADSARILAVLPMEKSHYQFCINVVKTLAERGHELVVIGPYDKEGLPDNVQYVTTGSVAAAKTLPPEIQKILHKVLPFPLSQLRTWYIMNTFTEYLTTNLTTITDFITKDKSSFDLVIIEEFFVQAFYPLARKYKAPLVLLSSFGTGHFISEYLGNSLDTSYVPHEFYDVYGEMSFLQRMTNFLYTTFDIIGRKLLILYVQNGISERIFEKEFDIWTHVGDIEREVSLVFFNSHYSMSVSKPLLPNMIEIGGLHIKKPKPLPQDIKTILDKATNGAILFSFGSLMDLSYQPEDLLRVISAKFIMSHPNLKAFVTHGGLNSQLEAVYHGIPIVCVPFFGDQPHNCLKSEVKGFGLMIPYSELNENSLYVILKQVNSNEKFKNSAKEMSVRFQDRPLSPKESVVFWTEYVLRHKGADFIKGPKRHMYWFQTTHLDVVLVLILSAWVLKKVVVLMCRRFCTESKRESKFKRS